MPQCRACNSVFPNLMLIEGKLRNLQRRKFCPSCSPFGSGNTSKNITSFKSNISNKKTCPVCKLEKSLSDFYFQDKTHTTRRYDCKTCSNFKVTEWQRELKQKCVDSLGGSCAVCGEIKSIYCFDFHHIDPSKKDFQLSQGRGRKFSSIEKELNKCILVCSNCHREIHAGLHSQYLVVKEQLTN